MEIVMGKFALGNIFLCVIRLHAVSIILSNLRTHCFL